ncbi:poly-gamma-glutamate hydrolase family protein [Pseudenhygromyxa sp. WMMC2535]|uniref:poly-gamma-glutamate hydrolase family protein n=1 Tax=Pseudenhygromyxa sp. WMMC2535 TaxID=2712867 RepID=UPI0015571993|nr:poly-gamma-glutamate hydrolase family protein [Pseudenhygromyxa sp. WMMC2535]NVB42025.1 poly-gamma-glutamate hydrolase family protein [Pseudenhygromyxa sp. WMMC2535]
MANDFDRRRFMQLLGAATLPLLSQGCDYEDAPDTLRNWDDDEPSPFVDEVESDGPEQVPVSGFSKDVSVRHAFLNQLTLITDECACSITPELAAMADLDIGDQVRITRDSDNYALYTVKSILSDNNDIFTVRMGLSGRQRLGTSEDTQAELRTSIFASTNSINAAKNQSEFIEELIDDDSHTGLIACAAHGGWIESRTDKQAERLRQVLASKNPSSWICRGYRQGGGSYDRWHITSEDLSTRSHPGLAAVANRGFAYAVSFHGMSNGSVLIGGGGPLELKQAIRAAILMMTGNSNLEVYIAQPDDLFNGDSPKNFVNWLTAGGNGGIQIEQSYAVRQTYWREIADAVAIIMWQLI